MKRLFPLVVLLKLASLAPVAVALTTDELLSLELRSPLPTAGNLSVAVSMGEGAFLVAGNGGDVARSEDVGETWASVDAPEGSWRCGASSGELHVLAGPSTWAVSSGGLNWRTGKFSTSFIPSGIAYGNGTFLVAGTNRSVFVSSDGESWAAVAISDEWSSFGAPIHDGDRFLSVSLDNILASPDGETWSQIATLPSEDVRSFSFAEDTYFAGGRNGLLYTSPDAITWTIRETGVVFPIEFAFKAHGRYYVKASGGNLLITQDFENFERVTTLVSGQSAIALDSASGVMIACGLAGVISRSIDGSSWSDQRKIVGNHFDSVAYGNGIFVTADTTSGIMYHSADGVVWTPADVSITRPSDIVFYQDQFRAIGSFGMITSPDGITWATVEGPGNVGGLERLLVANERLIGVRPTGSLHESADGETWTEHVLPTSDRLEHIAYGKGLYVVVGKGSAIYTSPDLETWTARPLASEAQLKRVFFDGAHFYAFDNLRQAPLVSEDGIVWEVPEDMPAMTGRGAQWDSELGIYFIDSGTFQWHTPGAAPNEWQSFAFPIRLDVNQVAVSDEGTIIAVGDSGLIMSGAVSKGGYVDWIASHFPDTEAYHGGCADPDKDGQSNLEEYVAGTDPAIPNSSQSTIMVDRREGDVSLSWKQVAAAEGVSVSVETSENLQTWRTFADTVIDDRSEIHTVTVALPSNGTPNYYRLRWDLE